MYAMLGQRPDREQRQFSLFDLLSLCAVFDVRLYELVIPVEDVRVGDDPGVEVRAEDIMIEPGEDLPPVIKYIEAELPPGAIGRDALSMWLFGYPVPPKNERRGWEAVPLRERWSEVYGGYLSDPKERREFIEMAEAWMEEVAGGEEE